MNARIIPKSRPGLALPTLVLCYTTAPSYQQDACAVRGPVPAVPTYPPSIEYITGRVRGPVPALLVLPYWCSNLSDADDLGLGRGSTYLPS
jgi:hypothetical protein